jgi:hypothetical protein
MKIDEGAGIEVLGGNQAGDLALIERIRLHSSMDFVAFVRTAKHGREIPA